MSILGDLKPPCSDEVDECGIPYVLDGDGCRIHPEILVPILNAIPALEKRLEEAEKGWEAQKKLYENRCDKYHVLEAENAAMREVVEQEVYCPTCGSCGVDECCSPTKCERVRCLYGEDCVESYRKAIEEAETLSDENAKLKLVVDAARMVLDGEPHPQYNPDGSSKVAPLYIIDTLQVAIALLDGKEPNA